MLEDDAKTKNCPMFSSAAMIVMATIGAPDAAQFVDEDRKCEGSACMLWRKQMVVANYSALAGTAQIAPDHGYCGLAGTP